MPVLPFHRYIGPGNDIDSGPCVDDDDCIAKKHDIKYENAKTPEDVRLADVEAIEEFRANWMSGNWHSLIGDIGLSLKYCVETYTGVIYPKLGEYEPCEIIPLFHDIIKLHCVNKVRLVQQVERYEPNAQPLQIKREAAYDLANFDGCKNLESLQSFFNVLVMWYQLYHKSREVNSPRTDLIPTLTYIEIRKMFHDAFSNAKVPVQISNSFVQNCDIFNFNAWMRFFSMIQPSKQKISNQYNDDDLSNMFMLYD